MRAALIGLLLASCARPPAQMEAVSEQPASAKQCRPADSDPAIPANAPANSTWLAAGKPIPERFRGAPAGWLKIQFMEADEVNRVCAGGQAVCGRIFYACVRGDTLIMPNPCDEPGAPEDKGYAGTLCHEVAHVNGWPATHGD
jgi:hypothetical protein